MSLRFLTLLLLATALLPAQTQFEVASIKPNTSGSDDSREHTTRGRLTVTNDTLKDLVRFAYEVKDYQIVGGPRWFDADHFDIVATIPSGIPLTDSALRPLLQALLMDRFQLKVHHESKEMSVYSLIVAKNGPKLKEHVGDELSRSSNSRGKMQLVNGTAEKLASNLSHILGHTVIDKSGLQGHYDLQLEWASDRQPESAGPSIFTAVQEQLGLKLESAKGPVQMLVIESAQKPSEN